MGKKHKRSEENKIRTKAFPRWMTLGLLALILAGYAAASAYKIDEPFIHFTDDVSGPNGIAAENLGAHGPIALKFGFFTNWISDPSNPGSAYTHHPSLFLIPTAIVYKIFGISETTTRLGLFLLMFASLAIFFFALKKITGNARFSLLSILFFVLLPGTVYYGKSFELTVFAVPAALITFSLFAFFRFEERETRRRTYFWLFLASIPIGAQMAWFFYFLPVGIWIFLLTKHGRDVPNRSPLLFLIPVLLALSFGVTMLQFFLLNGPSFFSDFMASFQNRTQAQPFGGWVSRMWWITDLNITWLFFLAGISGFLAWTARIKKDARLAFLLPVMIFPFFVLVIFRQWSTHPFGVIPFLPLIALGSAILIDRIAEHSKPWGLLAACGIIAFGGYLSSQRIQTFYNELFILGGKDVALAREIGSQVGDYDVCLGTNPAGLGVEGIIQWYMRKNIAVSPQCSEKNPKIILAFHPSMGAVAEKEIKDAEEGGYAFLGCADLLCVLEKANN